MTSAASRSINAGIRKPEPLRDVLQGCWSRRIDGDHRLVYMVEGDHIIVPEAQYHYDPDRRSSSRAKWSGLHRIEDLCAFCGCCYKGPPAFQVPPVGIQAGPLPLGERHRGTSDEATPQPSRVGSREPSAALDRRSSPAKPLPQMFDHLYRPAAVRHFCRVFRPTTFELMGAVLTPHPTDRPTSSGPMDAYDLPA